MQSPLLIEHFCKHISDQSDFHLIESKTPLTDIRALSLISLQTIRQLSVELNRPLDQRRFRANIILDLEDEAFAEDHLIGKAIQIGGARIRLLELVPRCRLLTYDPDAPHLKDPLFEIMKLLDSRHQGRAGVFARVERAGTVHVGDAAELVDRDQ